MYTYTCVLTPSYTQFSKFRSSWGFSWASFFFTLSGFVLAHSQANKLMKQQQQQQQSEDGSDDQRSAALRRLPTQFDFFKRRLTTIWPLYFASLVLSAWHWPVSSSTT